MTPRLRSTSAILVAFVVSLGVYAASLRANVSLWDTGDLQTVPYILGIPYPTGFPGFVLGGWVWTHLEPFGNVAWRMNLLTAVASATTAAALAAALITAGVSDGIALAGALAYAFGAVPWEHATYVDVHPVSFAAVALAVVFAFRWERDGRRADAAATLGAALAALACDNTTVLAMPGLALIVAARRPSWPDIARGLVIGAGVLTAVYAYLPLRSAFVTAWRVDPTLALGLPPGRPFWDDGHPSSPAGFLKVVAGTRFAPHQAAAAMLAPATLHRLVDDFGADIRRDVGDGVLWLALAGGAIWWWRAPLLFGGLVLLGAIPLLFVFAYPSESDTSRYFFGGYLAIVALAAYAADALRTLPRVPRLGATVAGVCLLVAVLAADEARSADLFAQPAESGAAPFLERVRRVTRDDAIVVAPWTYATALGYGAYVEHSLGRRIVVTADPQEDLARYRVWLVRRPLVVISDDEERFAGFDAREIDRGSPHFYALR